MSNISEIVEALEIKIHQMVKRQKESEKEVAQLKEQIEEINRNRQDLEEQVQTWRDRCNSLKLANSMQTKMFPNMKLNWCTFMSLTQDPRIVFH